MPITPQEAITVIERVAASGPGYRRGHARGLALRGSFTPSPEARSLTVAAHMQGPSVPCVIRVSNASGNPCSPDRASDKEGRVLGLAVRFELPGKAATWAAINIRAFPARTPDEFIALTAAQAPGKNGKPSTWRLLSHLIRHLHILAAAKGIKALKPAKSLSMEAYHGVHTYYFVDAAGHRKPFRYSWIPKLGAGALSSGEAAAQPKLYLLDEIRERLAKGPIAFDLVAQFPAAGDPLDDASVAWPADRPQTLLGRLEIDRVHEDQKAVENMVFDPTNVVSGIEISDDPILKFRAQIYGLSYDRRSKEKRVEPAPEDMLQI